MLWAIIACLILANSLYVAAEFGAVGVRRSRLRRLTEDGNRLAGRLLPIIEAPRRLDRYIAASQIGITLSSLVLGAYAQAVLAPRLEPLLVHLGPLQPVATESAAVVIVLTALTGLQLVVGELVPKALALQYPTQTALLTVLPMQVSLRLFAWFIPLLNGSGLLLLRLLGIRPTGHHHIHSPEEIELLIAESRDGGLLEPEEQARLHRALRLNLRTARHLMVPRARVAALDVDTPAEQLLAAFTASPYTRLPVYHGAPGEIVGFVHTKDLARDVLERKEYSIERLLRPIVRVAEDMPADRLLAFLRERRSQIALVVDRHNTLIGLVTLEDVLAELLGGVSDEFKTGRAQPADAERRVSGGGGRRA